MVIISKNLLEELLEITLENLKAVENLKNHSLDDLNWKESA